ncbi:hypothetical protein [Paenibacillus gorillae]|uniref:hypothetical protein n=1 Tax=Paenibacillus gorillae TaxID=1243662 RepID=UPI0004B06C32|nr:hypothetical protein [Paenibacillus gorillae]
MKNKFKMLAVTATAILSLTIAGHSFAAAGQGFQEANNAKIQISVSSLQKKGIIKGDQTGRVEINATLPAAQGVQLLVNAFGFNLDTIRFFKEPHATDYFKKADDKAWYAQALIIAAANDLGLPNDLDPKKVWTKEEFTHYLMIALEKKIELPAINEDSSNREQLSWDVKRALILGIATLDTDYNFNPKKEITSGEAAEMVYNALKYLETQQAPNQQS